MNRSFVGVMVVWLFTLSLGGSSAQDSEPALVPEQPPPPLAKTSPTPASAPPRQEPLGGGSPAEPSERDPFATPPAMRQEAVEKGSPSGGATLPLITLRAYLELEGKQPVALLEISGVGLRKVRAGDSLTLQSAEGGATALQRRKRRARVSKPRPSRPADLVMGDGEDAPEAGPASRAAPPPKRSTRATVVTLKILDVRDGQVLIELPSLNERLTVN